MSEEAPPYDAGQPMQVTIEIPMVPGRACSPNGGWSWRERAKAKYELRECARLSTYIAIHPDTRWIRDAPRVVLDAEVFWCCGRKRMDDDNVKAALKGAIDGIADELWQGEDKHVIVGTVTQTRGEGVTRITLRGES